MPVGSHLFLKVDCLMLAGIYAKRGGMNTTTRAA